MTKLNKNQLNGSMWKGANSRTFQKAQLLRDNMTVSEEILWNELKGNKLLGFKFRRQHPIGHYIVDFYCHKLKMVVEVDGKYHDLKEQQKYDEERTGFLNFNGLKVIRFKNEEIAQDVEKVIQELKNEIKKIGS